MTDQEEATECHGLRPEQDVYAGRGFQTNPKHNSETGSGKQDLGKPQTGISNVNKDINPNTRARVKINKSINKTEGLQRINALQKGNTVT